MPDIVHIYDPANEDPPYQANVKLVGQDGNAFSLIGLVRQGLRLAGAPPDYITGFTTDAMSGDYTHVLAVCARACRDGGM